MASKEELLAKLSECVIVLIVSLISALLPIVLPVFAVLLALSYLQKKL